MSTSEGRVKIALVGIGPHAEASWLPAINDMAQAGTAELSLAVDITEAAPKQRLKKAGIVTTFVTVDKLPKVNTLTPATAALLKKHASSFDLMIVATEPKAHVAYASWAAENAKHVIIDKPISTREGSIYNPRASAGLIADWKLLRKVHGKHPAKLMVVNAHRRFEPAYLAVLNLLAEVRDKTAVGLTYAYLHHSDGQWRTREEIETIGYHGFLDGTGKIGHSGYHFIDYWACAVAASLPKEKLPDRVTVVSQLHQPLTYFKQVNSTTNEKFLEGYTANHSAADRDYSTFGEIDAFASASLEREGIPISHMQLALTHSGVSQRLQGRPHEDLYRSNGRVRHVYVAFQQGPFQTVTISSEQAYQPFDTNPIEATALGGANHLDITVWRNKGIGNPGPVTIKGAELMQLADDGRRMHEKVKSDVLKRVVQYIRTGTEDARLAYSDISQHQVAPQFAKAMYESYQQSTKNPVVAFHPIWPDIEPPHINLNRYEEQLNA